MANLQLSTWNFFERHLYDKRNGLNTLQACFGDIGTFWESLMCITGKESLQNFSHHYRPIYSMIKSHSVCCVRVSLFLRAVTE